MALPNAVEREAMHRRTVNVWGYRRKDQLWDIEAHLTDSRAKPFVNPWRGEVLPGEPLHDMWLRLTVDDGFKIHALEVASDKSPYPACSLGTIAFARLVGLTIEPGWKKKVKERVGGAAGCIHLAELLDPIGSVVMQTILPYMYEKGIFEKNPRSGLIDSCYAYQRSGEVVERLWPSLPRPNS
ncbi:DUF2889 domain-containing protein [Bradyrhizobium sp. 145]|uniref:DUF2889 domain-containing protein n=1 Tax=Bradyrhizobium sp. 145 TaxID=2782621 RepID=UPI001FFAFE2D|nr:DUF2889 domain-containing protein [Bradyrhizobium sp. 145]MCK1690455.1 DUF2889 domain-containing protein [Bradyrhizobium sp. 145]